MFKLKIIACITILALAIFQAGCVPQGQEGALVSTVMAAGSSNVNTPAAPSTNPESSNPPGEAMQTPPTGEAMQSPEEPVSNDPAYPPPESLEQDLAVTNNASGGGVGASDGAAGIEPADNLAAPEQPDGWQTYVDPSFGFSINHPVSYNYGVNPELDQAGDPVPVYQVQFLEGIGEIDIVQFGIEIFENSGGVPLEGWLDAYAPDGTRTPIEVSNRPGYQVTLSIEIAPNQFYYVADGDFIYKLTPLGPNGQEMLNSFQLQ